MSKITRQATDVVSVSLPKNLKTQLLKFSKDRGLSASQVASDALRRYIFLAEWRDLQKAFAPVFKRLGIKTDDDVEKYFG